MIMDNQVLVPQAEKEKWISYGIMLAVPKVTEETIQQAIQIANAGHKPYILEYGDRVPLMTSTIDWYLCLAIEVLEKKGIKVFQVGGTPTPPKCPPTGCPE